MPDPIKPGTVSFDISFKKARASEPIDEDAPLRIVILGDFSARTGGDANVCRAIRVDCDNFDAACGKFGASLHLPPCAEGALEMDIPFKKLDDFHPDQLLRSVAPLANLAQLRARLLSPGGAEEAAGELRGIFSGGAVAPAAEPAASGAAESMDDTFSRLLGKPKSEAPASAAPSSIVERLLKQAVATTAAAAPSAENAQLLSMLDAELAARLRRVLHHPDFQALEAAWRGLDFLVRESGDEVQLHVIDVSRQQLDQQLASVENPAASPIGRAIEQIAPAVILSAFSFGPADSGALQKIGRLAAACGTAFIGGAASELVGCASFGTQPNPLDWAPGVRPEIEAFAELRRMPEAPHIGLVTPRFLVRLPYGKESDSIQAFPFEELSAAACHECYLWASSAFLCGHRLINAFADDGWEMELGGVGGEIGGLPVHSFKVDGEKQAKPCAEAWLPEKAADVILSRGIMPALSVRGRDSVILVSMRSISDPASPLEFRKG